MNNDRKPTIADTAAVTTPVVTVPKVNFFVYGLLIFGVPVYESIIPVGLPEHLVFYILFLAVVREVLARVNRSPSKSVVPGPMAIAQAQLPGFLLISIVGLSGALFFTEQSGLIFPLVVLHTAFYLFAIGKFYSRTLKLTSLVQLALAIASIYFLKTGDVKILFPVFNSLYAASFIVAGFLI